MSLAASDTLRSPRPITTPVALLVGIPIAGLFLAVAVFLGLRGRAPSTQGVAIDVHGMPPASMRAPGSAPPAPTVAVAPNAPAFKAGPVALAAASALAEQHDAVAKACWLPNAGGPINLSSVRYRFHVELDADGNQTHGSRMIAAGPTRPEIDRCLGATLKPIHVPASGAPSAADLVLTLP